MFEPQKYAIDAAAWEEPARNVQALYLEYGVTRTSRMLGTSIGTADHVLCRRTWGIRPSTFERVRARLCELADVVEAALVKHAGHPSLTRPGSVA